MEEGRGGLGEWLRPQYRFITHSAHSAHWHCALSIAQVSVDAEKESQGKDELNLLLLETKNYFVV